MNITKNSPNSGIEVIACPQCGKAITWIEKEKYRPFCSKRCQMIDFGDWANERNSIPAEDPPDDWEDFKDKP
jgi:endogenous inhibitor of DNA gyrase (YacG/DUF329 family)